MLAHRAAVIQYAETGRVHRRYRKAAFPTPSFVTRHLTNVAR